MRVVHKKFKGFRKTIYRAKTKDLKRIISFMLIGGFILSSIFTVNTVYNEYATATAHVSLVYPEIAEGKYSDGSRFTYYDLINKDRVKNALESMQKSKKYENYTVEMILNNLKISSYLEKSVKGDVSTMRSAGNDYSYVANEYVIGFTQPHDYKNKKFIKKIITPDYSKDFLQELVNVNKEYMNHYYGGGDGFKELINTETFAQYDYSEKVTAYRTKLNSILSFLQGLDNNSGGYVSKETNKSIKDIINLYKILNNERLDQISNYIEASGLSKDIETLQNRLRINVENDTLAFHKFNDSAYINEYAKNSYDHTFTENLIVVSKSNNDGLYQARPKTIFDTVVEQYHNSTNDAIDYQVKIDKLNKDIQTYGVVVTDPVEYSRLVEKCSNLQDNFDESYQEIGKIAQKTVSEYLDNKNKSFIKYDVKYDSKININFIINIIISFLTGMAIVFVLYVGIIIIADIQRLRKKRKILKKLTDEE